MFFLFLVDTSSSMNRRTPRGLTLLDCAKSAVEHFVRVRARDPSARTDHYLLVTISGVCVGWRSSPRAFLEGLKNLKAFGPPGGLASALRRSISLLNAYRGKGIDSYGHGRKPWFVEPSATIVLTGGGDGRAGESTSFRDTMRAAAAAAPCANLSTMPHRWDQRVFPLVLMIPADRPGSGKGHAGDDSAPPRRRSTIPALLRTAADTTNGKLLIARSLRGAMRCMETFLAKLRPAVSCRFEIDVGGVGGAPGGAPALSLVRVAPVGKPGRRWPIPESYLPDPSLGSLPLRDPHPTLVVATNRPLAPRDVLLDGASVGTGGGVGLAPDFYEVDPTAPVCGMIPEGPMLPLFVRGSAGGSGAGKPFGFIQKDAKRKHVRMALLPYDFTTLAKLLVELAGAGSDGAIRPPSAAWLARASAYLNSAPQYTRKPILLLLRQHGVAPRDIKSDASATLSVAVQMSIEKMMRSGAPFSAMEPADVRPADIAREGCSVAELKALAARIEGRLLASLPPGSRFFPHEIPVAARTKHALPIADMGDYMRVLRSKRVLRDPLSDDLSANGAAARLRVNFGSRYRRPGGSSRAGGPTPPPSPNARDAGRNGGSVVQFMAVDETDERVAEPADEAAAGAAPPCPPSTPPRRRGRLPRSKRPTSPALRRLLGLPGEDMEPLQLDAIPAAAAVKPKARRAKRKRAEVPPPQLAGGGGAIEVRRRIWRNLGLYALEKLARRAVRERPGHRATLRKLEQELAATVAADAMEGVTPEQQNGVVAAFMQRLGKIARARNRLDVVDLANVGNGRAAKC